MPTGILNTQTGKENPKQSLINADYSENYRNEQQIENQSTYLGKNQI